MNDPKIYITSDLHLGHANIIKYCNRPYEDVEEMNDDLIRRWNETVRDNDRIFFLGDFALGSAEQIIKWGNMLKGRKVMIYGNHDHHKPIVYYNAGFEHVSKWPIVIQNRFLLSHAPMFAGSDSGVDPGNLINIHGHIHDKTEQGPTIGASSACVCVERWDYAPVDLSILDKEIRKAAKK
ncbi:MAG: metallophosphoesterase [Mogibacterium sp.]|nr:metallophosphoesterase [Mogibacterium sp.]